MDIYVIVENGIVVNRTQAESPLAPTWIKSDVAQIGWGYAAGKFTPPVTVVDLDGDKTAFIVKIDADADAIYAAALGNRETEYARAEADAIAFKAAAYAGTAPSYVQSWATATGKTATWAADNILATSAAWRSAQALIRLNRLGCKESARSATTMAQLDSVRARWATFVTTIKAQLSL